MLPEVAAQARVERQFGIEYFALLQKLGAAAAHVRVFSRVTPPSLRKLLRLFVPELPE